MKADRYTLAIGIRGYGGFDEHFILVVIPQGRVLQLFTAW